MCYVCHCFSWILDLIQRVITFFLACWMALAVCLGLTVAAVAGIAYGYNYSMAEFITYTRSDVSIYMRRGQFADRPDVDQQDTRKAGDRRFPHPDRPWEKNKDASDGTLREGKPNITDYEEQSVDDEASPLSSSLQKARDTNKYVEQLVKYETPRDSVVPEEGTGDMPMAEDNNLQNNDTPPTDPPPTDPPLYYKLTTPRYILTKLITETPVVMSTAYLQSGSSQIVMRNFQPIEDMTSLRNSSNVLEDDDHRRSNVVFIKNNKDSVNKNFVLPKTQHVYKNKPTRIPELRTRFGSKPQRLSTMRMRHWSANTKSKFKDEVPEEPYEEESYKPTINFRY